jgi:hypothetical protein
LGSEDHNQRFGLPAPVDARETALMLIGSKPITNAVVDDGTLDIRLHLANGTTLEVLPTSSGYEAWELTDPSSHWIIAQGGGNLVSSRD